MARHFQYIYRVYWCLRVAWDTNEKTRSCLRYELSFIRHVLLASNSKGTNMSYKCTENVEPQAQSRQLWGRVSTLLPWTIKLRKRAREAFPSFINRYISVPALDHACIKPLVSMTLRFWWRLLGCSCTDSSIPCQYPWSSATARYLSPRPPLCVVFFMWYFCLKYTHLLCVVHGQFVEIRKLVGPDVLRFLASVHASPPSGSSLYWCQMARNLYLERTDQNEVLPRGYWENALHTADVPVFRNT